MAIVIRQHSTEKSPKVELLHKEVLVEPNCIELRPLLYEILE